MGVNLSGLLLSAWVFSVTCLHLGDVLYRDLLVAQAQAFLWLRADAAGACSSWVVGQGYDVFGLGHDFGPKEGDKEDADWLSGVNPPPIPVSTLACHVYVSRRPCLLFSRGCLLCRAWMTGRKSLMSCGY